jgi:3-oxoacyl-[acyl-carrier protein] reductase
MSEPLPFSGKTALVTGASRGIGAAIAKRLAAEGANVTVNYLNNADAAEQVVAAIQAAGGQARTMKADVGDPAACAALVAETLQHFGRLDILVNNAALAEAATLAEVTEEHVDRHIATNVKGTLFLSQAAARVFGDQGGAIINISSIGTRSANPRFLVYAATKAAIELMTATMARELGERGIRVNAVAPGQIDTEMLRRNIPAEVLTANIARISLGRLGLAEDIARVVAFLASDEARWITGETIHVSGGQRL